MEGASEPVDGPATPVIVVLTAAERRRVQLMSLIPVLVVLAWRGIVLAQGRGTVGDLIVGVLIYGGISALTVGVLLHERLAHAHCPRCDAAGQHARAACEGCGHDLEHRPIFRCPERHARYLDPGLCDCGQRLSLAPPPRGIGVEIKRMLWMGAWVAALLLGTVVILRYVLS